MRRDSLLLLGLMTTICLIIGLIAGIQSGKFVVRVPQASPTGPRATAIKPAISHSTFTPASNLQPTVTARQMALLIVGVANRNALQPKFEAAGSSRSAQRSMSITC